MGRMKPSWYYERQATEANAREQYYVNRQPPAEGATIQSRGKATEAFYRSLIVKDGAESRIFKVQVADTTIAKVTLAEAGLKPTLAATEFAYSIRGSGVTPTKVFWYKGDTTPSRKRTPWNSSYIKYYDDAGGRSHFSMPFSKVSGEVTPEDLKTAFNTLFGGSKKDTLLGAENGRAYMVLERVPQSVNT